MEGELISESSPVDQKSSRHWEPKFAKLRPVVRQTLTRSWLGPEPLQSRPRTGGLLDVRLTHEKVGPHHFNHRTGVHVIGPSLGSVALSLNILGCKVLV